MTGHICDRWVNMLYCQLKVLKGLFFIRLVWNCPFCALLKVLYTLLGDKVGEVSYPRTVLSCALGSCVLPKDTTAVWTGESWNITNLLVMGRPLYHLSHCTPFYSCDSFTSIFIFDHLWLCTWPVWLVPLVARRSWRVLRPAFLATTGPWLYSSVGWWRWLGNQHW